MSFSLNDFAKQAKTVSEDNLECQNCKGESVVFDHGTGEKICSGCGIVLSVEREYIDLHHRWRIMIKICQQ